MPWQYVQPDAADAVIDRCISCFVNADYRDHKFMNRAGERGKLKGSYRETDGSMRDVYRLSAYYEEPYVDEDDIEIVIALYKSIDRFPSNKSTTHPTTPSVVRERDWNFSVGFSTTKTAQQIYDLLKARLIDFYQRERDIVPGTGFPGTKTRLTIFSEKGAPAATGKLLAINNLFAADGEITKTNLPNKNAYTPFAEHLQKVKPAAAHKLVRQVLEYTPP